MKAVFCRRRVAAARAVWALVSLGVAFFSLQAFADTGAPADRPRVDRGLTSVQEALAQDIGATLRCPVCQGMPIADSPAQMAQDMMRLVREKLAGGATRDEVEQYFVVRYGAWVLLRPPTTGVGIWIWVLPPVALISALLVLVWALTRARTPSPQDFATARTPVALPSQDYARVRTWISEERD